MTDFKLSEKAWAAAGHELSTLGIPVHDSDRIMIEFFCDRFVRRRRGVGPRPSPDKYGEAWRAVSKLSEELLEAIDRLRDIGAAELEFLAIFPGGDEIAKSIRLRLPELSQLALVVAEIEETTQHRIPPKADPARDELAGSLIGFWNSKGGGGTIRNGPASRFLEATFSEAMAAAGEAKPNADALRKLLRTHGESNRGKSS